MRLCYRDYRATNKNFDTRRDTFSKRDEELLEKQTPHLFTLMTLIIAASTSTFH